MSHHSRMESCTGFYHVYNRGIDQIPIFEAPQQKYFFMHCIRDALKRYCIFIFSYCIMDNHMHILLSGELKEISKFMQFIESRYASTFNYCNDRIGHVFQNTYKSKPVMNERYLWGLIRYIHLNPVKAGLCTKPTHYHFSSMFDYINKHSQNTLLSNHAVSFIQQSHPYIQDFLSFHEKDDRFIYDDVPEDINIQEEHLIRMASSYINSHYHIKSWDDVRNNPLYDSRIICVLHHEFHLSIQKIVDLLGISRYKVKQAITSEHENNKKSLCDN